MVFLKILFQTNCCPILEQRQSSLVQGCSCCVKGILNYVFYEQSSYVSDSVNKKLNCRRDSSSLTFCCLSFTLYTYYILHTFCTVEPRVIGWMWFCLGFFIHSVWIVWQMQRIPHILTLVFLFLCLIRHLASLRISYQQPLHSSELGTRVTELYNGIKICRLSKS